MNGISSVVRPLGRKPHNNPTNLTHSTPIYSLQGLVGGDLASGSPSASGVWEQIISGSFSMVSSFVTSGPQ